MNRPLALALLLALLPLLTACPSSTPPSLNVSGKVLDYFSGQPRAFLPVMVGGKVVSSDASGNFSATGVSSPYQLVVLQPDRKTAQVYQGVTRADPIVLVFQSNPIDRKAKLTVNYSGSGSGSGLSDLSNPVNGNFAGGVGAPGSSTSTDLQWSGPSSFEGNLCAILFKSTNGVATTINAFGQRNHLFVQDGQTVDTGLDLEPVTNQTLSGSIGLPPGFTLSSKTLGFVCGPNAVRPTYPFTLDKSSTASFSYAAPVTTNQLYLDAYAVKGGASVYSVQFGVAPNASNISLVLPQPIEQQQPPNNAVGVSSSVNLAWLANSIGISVVSVERVSPSPLYLTIYTPNSSVALPDLSLLGYPTPKGTPFNWSVTAHSDLPTIGDALSGVPHSYNKNYSYSRSETWKFTTTP